MLPCTGFFKCLKIFSSNTPFSLWKMVFLFYNQGRQLNYISVTILVTYILIIIYNSITSYNNMLKKLVLSWMIWLWFCHRWTGFGFVIDELALVLWAWKLSGNATKTSYIAGNALTDPDILAASSPSQITNLCPW